MKERHMTKIKINDLPANLNINEETMRKVLGGQYPLSNFDLQRAITQYNQMINAVSNMSKKYSQTMDNIIRNIV